MTAITARNTPKPLLLPEIVEYVVDNICMVPDLLSCACVNSLWNVIALKKLYKGSLNDMRYRTPDIGSLNCLFVASRERFTQNMNFVKHLLLAPETPTVDDAAGPEHRLACFEKLRPLRRRLDAELLLRPQGSGIVSLTIPFEIVDQDWSLISDLLASPTIEYLAVDNFYCELLMATSRNSLELILLL
jgi:hypothetical protein